MRKELSKMSREEMFKEVKWLTEDQSNEGLSDFIDLETFLLLKESEQLEYLYLKLLKAL